MIALQNDDRVQCEQQRKQMLSLLRVGDAAALAQFDRHLRQFKVSAWTHAYDLSLQLQCWRLELIRREYMGRVVVR